MSTRSINVWWNTRCGCLSAIYVDSGISIYTCRVYGSPTFLSLFAPTEIRPVSAIQHDHPVRFKSLSWLLLLTENRIKAYNLRRTARLITGAHNRHKRIYLMKMTKPRHSMWVIWQVISGLFIILHQSVPLERSSALIMSIISWAMTLSFWLFS